MGGLLLCGTAHALTQARTPAACANDASIGTFSWNNAGNALASDDARASSDVTGRATSNFLKCTSYGFAIPPGARIDGITVNVERRTSSTGAGGSQDAAVRVVQNGVIGTADRSTTSPYTTADVVEPHGGATDLWALTWTYADINAAGFGAAFAAMKNNPAQTHTLGADVVGITVDYTPAPTVVSINRASPNPTSAAAVDWTVTFSEAVSGVDTTDFALSVSGLSGSSIVSVTGGPIVYTVTVSTGFGVSTLGLNLVDDDSIVNTPGLPLAGTVTLDGGLTGQLYNVNRPSVSQFNAFESATAANAIAVRVFTKRMATGFAVDIVAIASGAQSAGFSDMVQVDLVTGSSGGADCPGAPVAVAGTAQSVSISAGRGTTAVFNVASAFPDVRVRIRYPSGSPTVTSCSNDNFSIRPSGMVITSTDATNNDTSGTPTIKTGASFNLTATVAAGYTGTPAIDNTRVVGSPFAGSIGGAFGAGNPTTGIATGNGFFYSEAGNLGLNANAVYDASFTAVDQPGDCIVGDFSDSLDASGRYGCNFGSAAIAMTPGSSGFGRFIPDNFDVAYNAPAFTTACATGNFTYVGQNLPYAVAPQITVTARNGTANGLTNAVTRNYAGAYMKLSNTAGTSLNQAPYDSQDGRYARFDVLGGGLTPGLNTVPLPATTVDPLIGAFTEGVGTLTFASGLAMLRSTTVPSAPFEADIALSLNVIDTDGVAYAANPARFGDTSAGNGMAFSGGKLMRFGRLRLDNAVGSDKLDLQMRLRIEYWTGSSFAVNALDGCTTLSAKNFSLANHQPGLVGAGPGANMNSPTAGSDGNVAIAGSFVSGIASVTILKPSPVPTSPGSVDVCVDLDIAPGTGDSSCQAAVPADKRWLQMLRTNPPGTHTQDPVGRAAFGLYGGQPNNFIYFRENF